MRNIVIPPVLKYFTAVLALLLLPGLQLLHAEGGPPVPSSMENPFVIGFVILALILLLVIGLLANLLMGVAQVKMEKEKKEKKAANIVAATLMLLFCSIGLQAQTTENITTPVTSSTGIAGISMTAFYLMMSVIFLELLIILTLLLQVRILLKAENSEVQKIPFSLKWKAKFNTLWKRLNRFKPAEQEADIDLGHDYDGIRELDNRLPPWWLYGFYITIITACIYLYRYHISHTGLSSKEEYTIAIAKADAEVAAYLKIKGDAVDENTVTMLTAPDEIDAGKTIFAKSCVACHNEGGAGNVGPNLTDDYWLHGGDIKSVFKTIRYGINAMPQWQNSYSNKQIAELASYVKSLHGTHPATPKAPQGELYKDDTEKTTADSTKASSGN